MRTPAEQRRHERDRFRKIRGVYAAWLTVGPRPCDSCGEPFQPRQLNQRFDTARCRWRKLKAEARA